ncbi:MAG: exo-alpha-sialidase [Candidatus Latescibacteria bacterium]|nr:exo-alpha-sialidase [Candidatus Latescibacterota bacterium]
MSAGQMKGKTCYTEEWKRSNPDFAVYLPGAAIGRDTDNVHFLVIETPGGDLLGSWTQATYEAADNSCVVCARSTDGGATWSEPMEMDGPNEARYHTAYYAFPVVSRSGRIYYFYVKHLGIVDVARNITGIMRCRYSDDDGHTWAPPVEIPFKRREHIDSPDTSIPPNWVAYVKPVRDSKGRWIEPFSHWTSLAHPQTANCHIEMMRFENMDEGPDPKDIEITWLPGKPMKPVSDFTLTGLMEPCIVLLPDKRLFMTLRTGTGCIWYSVSEDDGATWRDAEPLRYQDGGERVLHPESPCPIYALQDGRFLLQYHNNDGSGSIGSMPLWTAPYFFSRRSLFLAVGEFRPKSHQPIWFTRPKRLADSDGVSAGVQYRTEMGTYGSLTEQGGKRILWYPDRKHFLLGKIISDELLESCGEVPGAYSH